MRRAVPGGCTVVIQEETETAGAWTCSAPIDAITEHGVLCCKKHAQMLYERGFKVWVIKKPSNMIRHYITDIQ